MAEYIKAEDAIPYLTKYIPSVEAVERSKIDKAIDEIKQEIENGTIKITSGNERLFNILRNIEE